MRGGVVVLCVLGTLGCALLIPSLQQDNQEHLFLAREARERYERFQTTVPERAQILVRVDFESGLPPAYLTRFREVVEAVHLRRPDHDVLDFAGAYQELLRFTGADDPLAFARAHPSLTLDLLSDSHVAMLLLLPQQPRVSETARLIEELTSDPVLNEGTLSIAGLPYTNYLLNQYSDKIKPQIFPALLAIGLVFSMVASRSLRGGLFMFLPAVFSMAGSLALVRVLYQTMNMVTSITPLMIFVINLVLCYHVYFTAVELGGLREALRVKRLPLGLMVATTSVGFGALCTSEIEAIRQLGILSASLILITTSLSIAWLWALLPPNSRFLRTEPLLISERWFRRTLPLPAIIAMGVGIIGGAASTVGAIPSNTDASSYFPKSSGLGERLRALQAKTLCNPSFELVMAPEPGRSEADRRARLRALEERLGAAFDGKLRVVSRDSFVREAWRVAGRTQPAPLFGPLRDAIENRLPPQLSQAYPAEGSYRVTLGGCTGTFTEYLQQQQVVESVIAQFADLEVELNGIYFNLMHSQEALLAILARSFATSLAVIAAIFLLFYRSLKTLALFLLPNLLPPLSALPFLYAAGFSVNVATVMVFSVSLGMIVDSTLHVIHALDRRTWQGFDFYLKTTLVPLLTSSLLLIASFCLFGMSGFLPIRQFGLTLAFVLTVALVLDLFALPTLMAKRDYRLLEDSVGLRETAERDRAPGDSAEQKLHDPV